MAARTHPSGLPRVLTCIGSRAAVLRRSETTCVSSASDDEAGGIKARSVRSERQRAEQSNSVQHPEAYGLRHAAKLVDHLSAHRASDVGDHVAQLPAGRQHLAFDVDMGVRQ
jgi:hypothetical protein